eukprot:6184308-Pleurochrysis_carterae.AAC.5
MSNAARAVSKRQMAQLEGLHVTHGLMWSRTSIRAAIWQSSLQATVPPLLCIRIRLYGKAAAKPHNAVLKELAYYCDINNTS